MNKSCLRVKSCSPRIRLVVVFCVLISALMMSSSVHSAPYDDRYEQRIGNPLPLAAVWSDQNQRHATLLQRLDSQPAVLVFGYFHCQKLCHPLLHTLARTLQTLQQNPAIPLFRRIVVSINPEDTPSDAASLARQLSTPNQWQLLTGSGNAIADLANAAGFHYEYEAATHQFIHPAGLVFVTPEGKVSGYLPGLDFSPDAIAQGINTAAAARAGVPANDVYLRCYSYLHDPALRDNLVIGWLRLAGLLTLAVLGFSLWRLRGATS